MTILVVAMNDSDDERFCHERGDHDCDDPSVMAMIHR